MDMFVGRMKTKLLLLVLGAMTLVVVGCESSTDWTYRQPSDKADAEPYTETEAKEVDTAKAATVDATPSSPDGKGKPSQAFPATSPYLSRADPFREERVNDLEDSLRPIQAIPAKTPATVPEGG